MSNFFFFSSRRRHTRSLCDWSSDVCSSDLYRFSWIRDSSLTLEALYTGACSDEAVDFVSFMTASAGGAAGESSSLQIMYGIGGEHDLSERELPHLGGWRNSRPVRVGNGAWGQSQLDVYGELLNALYLYREKLGELHPEIQRFVAELLRI